MALLKMLALISVIIGAGFLAANRWPEKLRDMYASSVDYLEEEWGMSLDWLPGLSPEAYKGPASWLFPVGLWSLLLGLVTMVNIAFGLMLAMLVIGAYYLSDELSAVVPPGFERYYIFADKAWMKELQIPAWMRLTLILIAAAILSLEIGALAFLVTGIVLAIFTGAPDLFDWMGSWNVFRDRRLRLASLIMAAVGFLMAVREWHLDLLVLLALAAYAWYYFKTTARTFKTKFGSVR